MKDAPLPETALGMLRIALAEAKADPEIKDMIEAEAAVLGRYQPLFIRMSVQDLSREEFQGFLRFHNNHHWTGLERYRSRLCADMGRLRSALGILLDEDRPLAERLDEIVPKATPPMIRGFGKATISAILLVAHPNKYAVWNETSQDAMAAVGVWPAVARGATFGQRYVTVNDVLNRTASELGIDLWTLDALWWWLRRRGSKEAGPDEGSGKKDPEAVPSDPALFGLERHLHEFLFDNWEKTSLGREWDIFTAENDLVGYEYPCSVGKIDLLARHKKEKSWLVVELKRGQGSDDTVGQVLRYMGWVKENLAEPGDTVEGLIIAHGRDERIRYALKVAPGVSLMLYEVDFRLVPDTTN